MGQPTRPGESACATPLEPRAAPAAPWTEQELWVWQEVCLGRVADLAAHYDSQLDENKRYNPLHGTSWSEQRVLTSAFLETILLHAPYRTALPHTGVVIVGAWYREPVGLAWSRLTSPLLLPFSWFENGVAFDWAVAPKGLSLSASRLGTDAERPALQLVSAKLGFLNLRGATVSGRLDADEAEINGDLDLSNTALEGDVTMNGVKVDGDLEASGAKVNGRLDMESLVVGGDFFLHEPAELAAVNMLAGTVGGDLLMDGTVVRGHLGLDRLTLGGSLFLEKSAKIAGLDLIGASIDGDLVMGDLQSSGAVNMESLSIAGDLFLNQSARLESLSLFLASIGRDLLMNGLTVEGGLNMARLSTGGDIVLQDQAKIAGADLTGADVGGSIRLDGTTATGFVTMIGVTVAGDLDMTAVPEAARLDLSRADVGGAINLAGSKFDGPVTLTGARVGGNLYFSRLDLAKDLSMQFARVGSSIVFSGASLNLADLTAVSAGGDLVLGHLEQPVVWRGDEPLLVLRNAKVGALQDLRESWPDDLGLDLGGFSYSRLGGVSHSLAGDRMASRSSDWLVRWLSKDRRYSPQPYEQLASVLRAMGHETKAKDVLYGGRARARFESDDPWYSKLWQGLMLVLIGFGYRPYYAVGWIVLFVVIGAAVIRRTPEGKRAGITFGLAYSLDTLLPIIRLRESHYQIDFAGGWRPARYYFYFHQVMGYVLASFLVAGLSGLTK